MRSNRPPRSRTAAAGTGVMTTMCRRESTLRIEWMSVASPSKERLFVSPYHMVAYASVDGDGEAACPSGTPRFGVLDGPSIF